MSTDTFTCAYPNAGLPNQFGDPALGLTNPFFNSSVQNSKDLLNWLRQPLVADTYTELAVSEDEVRDAMTNPPTTTRAYFRGRCLAKWPADIVAANWDSLVFDVGGDPLRRVPMMEPLRGTADMLEELVESCRTPAELIERHRTEYLQALRELDALSRKLDGRATPAERLTLRGRSRPEEPPSSATVTTAVSSEVSRRRADSEADSP